MMQYLHQQRRWEAQIATYELSGILYQFLLTYRDETTVALFEITTTGTVVIHLIVILVNKQFFLANRKNWKLQDSEWNSVKKLETIFEISPTVHWLIDNEKAHGWFFCIQISEKLHTYITV